jgi:alpha-galactosidase
MSEPMIITIIGASGWYAFDMYRRVFADARMRPVQLRIWSRSAQTSDAIGRMLGYVSKETGICDADYVFCTDRKEALRGAHYVLFAACVDYPRVRVQDTEVCEKHGIYPLEAETMTPGGLMNTFRHAPIALAVARELEEVSPNATIICVVNPLARLCDALNRHSKIRFIGHCDGIVHTRFDLSTAMGLNPDDVEAIAGGVNHLTFVLKLWHKRTGENLLPRIPAALPHIRQNGPFGFRFSNVVYKLLGYYPSPGDNHIADQLPFVSRAMQLSTPIPKLDMAFPPADMMKAGLAANTNSVISVGERIRDPKVLHTFLNPSRTEESGDWMLALHGRTPPRHMEALNIPNNGHITNLPANSIVEVPGDIDAAGARGYSIGALPTPLASLCQRMLVAHESAVEACVHTDRDAALRSLAFEPTVRDLYVLEDLLDDLLTVNARYLAPEFVAKMKKRDSSMRVALVEPAPDNPMRPDAPLPPGIPAQDVLTGAAWGTNLGNLSDADENAH